VPEITAVRQDIPARSAMGETGTTRRIVPEECGPGIRRRERRNDPRLQGEGFAQWSLRGTGMPLDAGLRAPASSAPSGTSAECSRFPRRAAKPDRMLIQAQCIGAMVGAFPALFQGSYDQPAQYESTQ
jgi:hypothetical protein